MAKPTPLAVAIVAAALLVVVVTVDVLMDRVYILEARLDGTWREIGRSQYPDDFRYASFPRMDEGVELNRSDTVMLRLRVVNGYPWPADVPYEASAAGYSIADGRIKAPARGEGEAAFEATLEELSGPGGAPRGPPKGDGTMGAYSVGVDVQVGGRYFGGWFTVQEVAR